MSVFRGASGGGGAGGGLAHTGSAADPLYVETPATGPVLVASDAKMVALTPALDTAAYAVGDILFDFVALDVLNAAGRSAALQSIVATDKADTGVTITFVLADALVDLGVPNAAPSITDADSFALLGTVSLAASDWLDLGGNRVASLRNIGLMVEAASATSVFVAAIITSAGAAGTFAASDLKLRFGFWRN